MKWIFCTALAAICLSYKPADITTTATVADTSLEAGFLRPPDEAKPRVFWWWLEGYQTTEGIREDLVAMKAAGIKGAIIFDAGSSSYNKMERTQNGPVYLGPEWQKLFHYATHVADSLDLELSLNIGSGWNDGGPWVTPQLASKKLVWSDTLVQGGRHINMQLAMPGKLLTDQNTGRPYYEPVVVLAVQLNPGSENIRPLENMDIKAVHSIYSIPFTPNGLGYNWGLFMKEEPSKPGEAHAFLRNVIDISNRVDAQGNLKWQAPAGQFAIIRFGYTGTGIKVSTHSPGGGGLAIDYMNRAAMDLQYNKVVTPLVRPRKSNSLKYLHDDSWELGASNWTNDFVQAFQQLNGYDIKKYLPVLTGRIIESRSASNRFLYDFRRTIADLIHDRHYKRFAELAAKDGMGIHSESGGPHPAPIDALKNLGLNAIPMGEFWIRAKTHRVEPHRRIYVKQSASAAHIYGKRFVQAEGPTSIGPHWEEDFAFMKPTLDRVYCEGLNRLVIHTYTHSPKSAGMPGNEYFAGTHFNPNVTWWNQAPAFLEWNSRISYMLSRGLFVGDIVYYYGDNVPNQVPLKHVRQDLGEGYDDDVCNSEVILTRMQVKNGKIVLPDGMSYHVLVLPEWKEVNVDVLAKLEQLVKAGATIVGPKPVSSAGLKKSAAADAKVRQLAELLWGKVDGTTLQERSYGKGKVIYGKPIRHVLHEKGVQPDFIYHSRKGDAHIDYIHRSTKDAEIYYIVNRKERPEYFHGVFRAGSKAPELWNPITGSITPQPLYNVRDGRVDVPLFLEPFGSTFVVFRKTAAANHYTSLAHNGKNLFPDLPQDTFSVAPFTVLPGGKMIFDAAGKYTLKQQGGAGRTLEVAAPQTTAVDGPWAVSFDKKWGGPEHIQFDQLISWTERPEPGIKYYSGTAVYRKTFRVTAEQLKNQQVWLDLGEMYNVAEVTVNGHHTGVWWQPPFRANVSEWVKAGENSLEVKVVNLWPNRIIGDQHLPENERFTKTNVKKFDKDYPLRKSGLIGPVKLWWYEAE